MSSNPNDSLNDEIEKSLAGINLQDIDMSPEPAQAKGADKSGLTRGIIEGISGTDVFVELGPRQQGVISLEEFEEDPKPGEVFDFSMHGMEKDGIWRLSRRQARMVAAWNDVHEGSQVKAMVTALNSGGLECTVGPISAFMPASHVDLARVEDLSVFVGQSFICEVIEADMSKKRIVLSRKKAMMAERDVAREETMAGLTSGDVRAGKVMRIESFGAFVDIGGIEGLLHVSNISRKRVEDINEVLNVGQQIKVMVLELKEGGKKIGLGMKQLEENPWDTITYRYQIDQVVPGKVTRLADFGAFVEIEDGIDGLLHISQIGATTRLRNAGEALTLGQELSVRIQDIDAGAERISLSRLDNRGAIIGSDESVASSDIDAALGGDENAGKTNLGDLFKAAMKK
ncbi:MAG: S1 RNA-binding domain-containing protein [Planctomycetota bacterium]|jgi:small subunit ribosomal protein S1|nr:S1 RNA-binding domain-containing protein [Planctomycetota bacterium]MDG2144190.1 S1 RNA-binding domain-containing protein [Planctomycetota bacterium]